jgi:hypothetical protein
VKSMQRSVKIRRTRAVQIGTMLSSGKKCCMLQHCGSKVEAEVGYSMDTNSHVYFASLPSSSPFPSLFSHEFMPCSFANSRLVPPRIQTFFRRSTLQNHRLVPRLVPRKQSPWPFLSRSLASNRLGPSCLVPSQIVTFNHLESAPDTLVQTGVHAPHLRPSQRISFEMNLNKCKQTLIERENNHRHHVIVGPLEA